MERITPERGGADDANSYQATPPPLPPQVSITKAKKISDGDWDVIKALYCQGVSAVKLAEKYPIKADTIRKKASKDQWATPGRINRALRSPKTSVDDPASAVAALWKERGEKGRESIYQGSQKALDRFFSAAPVPQSFAEAATAAKLMNEAITPPVVDEKAGNVNLAILSTQGFQPKRVVDVDVITEALPEPE